MSGRKTPPSIMQDMVIRLRANLKGDKLMRRCPLLRLTPRDEIRAWSSDSVFDHVSEEGGQDEGDCEAEDGDMCLV